MKEECFSPVRVHGSDVWILIHGATNSQMTWMPAALILNRLGHKAIALDLPGHGTCGGDITAQTMDDYCRRVMEAAAAQDGPVILCGHSMGGGVITEAAERMPEKVKALVYVAAHMPLPGHSCNGLHDSLQPIDWMGMSEDGKTVTPRVLQKNKGKAQKPVTKMAEAEAEWVARFLGREAIAPITVPLHHTAERWGKIPRYYVQTMQDHDLWTDLQQQYIDYWGCDAVFPVACDHDVLLASPELLAFILHHISVGGSGGLYGSGIR